MKFYKDKQIKRCKDCPFFILEESVIKDVNNKIHECETYYCTPVKDKYGYNETEKNANPDEKWFCRLTNEVTRNYKLEWGAFAGETILEVNFKAPKYIKALIENGVISIVVNFPNY